MLPIIKEVKQKMRAAGGFTLVELIVVLVILAILAGLGGAGLIAYTHLARFEHNEANARTVFQTAQIALTRKDTGGDMDNFLKQLAANGTQNGHFTAEGLQAQYPTGAEDKAKELNGRIVALYYDKDAPDTAASQQVHALLDPYVYDESLFNASIVLEIDSLTGQVYSAFYDTASAKMRFSADGDTDGATLVDDRSYTHRREASLVGYYSAEDTVNVVTLSQTRLKVKNPQLINNETLTLNWSGNSRYNDLDTIYDAEFYSTTSGDTPLFKLEIEWSKVAGYDQNARIKVYKQYNAATQTWTDSGETYCFPLSYSKGRFILTLDAMCDATLLRAAENDQTAAKTTLFSMTRLVSGAQDIYVKMKARPNDAFADACTESKEAQSNTENTLFAAGSTGTNAALKYFRHLYNLRWVNSGTYTWNDGTLPPQRRDHAGLDRRQRDRLLRGGEKERIRADRTRRQGAQPQRRGRSLADYPRRGRKRHPDRQREQPKNWRGPRHHQQPAAARHLGRSAGAQQRAGLPQAGSLCGPDWRKQRYTV